MFITDALEHCEIAFQRKLDDVGGYRATETIRACQSVGGLCVLILHNDSLSDYGEWRGWRQTVEEMIAVAKG